MPAERRLPFCAVPRQRTAAQHHHHHRFSLSMQAFSTDSWFPAEKETACRRWQTGFPGRLLHLPARIQPGSKSPHHIPHITPRTSLISSLDFASPESYLHTDDIPQSNGPAHLLPDTPGFHPEPSHTGMLFPRNCRPKPYGCPHSVRPLRPDAACFCPAARYVFIFQQNQNLLGHFQVQGCISRLSTASYPILL